MPLLSKAEIQYLEDHKQISKSYARKMKCMLQKKVEGLKKDISLIAKLIPISQIFSDNQIISNPDIVYQKEAMDNPSKAAAKIDNFTIPATSATEISSLTNPAIFSVNSVSYANFSPLTIINYITTNKVCIKRGSVA